jgi:hypothetical protein
VVPDPVRQHPEERRQDELREIEGRREQPDDQAVDPLAAVLRELRQVDRQHRAREARAEAERERAAHHGPQRAIHRVEA